MPYIKQEDRQALDPYIDELLKQLDIMGASDGEVNYVVTRILARSYPPMSYFTLQRAIGLLECIKQEFYRRVVAPYEDAKKEQRGDCY